MSEDIQKCLNQPTFKKRHAEVWRKSEKAPQGFFIDVYKACFDRTIKINKNKLLMHACARGDIVSVEDLITEGAQLSYKNSQPVKNLIIQKNFDILFRHYDKIEATGIFYNRYVSSCLVRHITPTIKTAAAKNFLRRLCEKEKNNFALFTEIFVKSFIPLMISGDTTRALVLLKEDAFCAFLHTQFSVVPPIVACFEKRAMKLFLDEYIEEEKQSSAAHFFLVHTHYKNKKAILEAVTLLSPYLETTAKQSLAAELFSQIRHGAEALSGLEVILGPLTPQQASNCLERVEKKQRMTKVQASYLLKILTWREIFCFFKKMPEPIQKQFDEVFAEHPALSQADKILLENISVHDLAYAPNFLAHKNKLELIKNLPSKSKSRHSLKM